MKKFLSALVISLCLIAPVSAADRDQYMQVVRSAARTATFNVDFAFDTTKYKGLILIFDCSARSGTSPTLDIKLQFKDPVSGNFVDITGASFAQKNATGTDSLSIYPDLSETANRRVSAALTADLRLVNTIAGTSPSFTYTVSATYLK